MSRYETLIPMRSSIIRKTTVFASECQSIDLGQGYPSERPNIDACLKAVSAIIGGSRSVANDLLLTPIEDHKNLQALLKSLPHDTEDSLNQYTDPRGMPELHNAVSKYYKTLYDVAVDPVKELTITLGSTEALSTAIRAVVPANHGIIIFQPFHEMYINQARLHHTIPFLVPLRFSLKHQQEFRTASEVWTIDMRDLERVIATATVPIKAIIVNSPHNPTGKVLTDQELRLLCRFCINHNLYMIKDDVYENIIYGDYRNSTVKLEKPLHKMLWSWTDLNCKKFVITVSSVSKMASATGWRVGWVLAHEELTPSVACIHDNLAMQAPTAFQYASESFLTREIAFYLNEIPNFFFQRYTWLREGLIEAGFDFAEPEGTFYLFATYTRIPPLACLNAVEASEYLTREVKVTAVPGDAFIDFDLLPDDQQKYFLRFAFCKSERRIKEAVERLIQWKRNNYQLVFLN